MDKNRFSQKTKITLKDRANSICSNPYCGVVTSGPHSEEDKSINLGEASHIRGANKGSKRYDETMHPEERANIVNGIWLCGKCAKLIDSDDVKYTVDLLFAWKRKHERKISFGMTGEKWERELLTAKIENIFSEESPTAMQIAIDKPKFWEYLLSIELLRKKISKIHLQYEELDRGVIFRRTKILDKKEYFVWVRESVQNILNIVKVFSVVVNDDLVRSWGPPGSPGDIFKIKYAVDLIEKACQFLMEWEVDVHFTEGPEDFQNVKSCMMGWTHQILGEISKISDELSKPLQQENPAGSYTITLKIDVPKNIAYVQEEVIRLMKMK